MNSAERLVNDLPNFYTNKPKQFEDWDRTFKQIIRHTRKVSTNELIEMRRPNEDDEVKEYRKKNHRRFSKSVIDELYSKISKILTESGLGEGTLSPILKEWLSTNPFTYQGLRTDLWSYWYRCVMPTGMEDANGAMLQFPYNKNNKDVPPSAFVELGGLQANERVSVMPKLIPYYDIVMMPNEYYQVFAWKGGQMKIKQGKNEVLKPYYFVVDENWYYRYIPTGVKDSKGNYLYELEEWYEHDTGIKTDDFESNELPVSFMAGILTSSEDGKSKYHESFLQGACERFDEFDVRFSDNQIVNTRFAHPLKMVNGDISCKKCGGTGQENKQKRQENGSMKMISVRCSDCKGKRHSQDSPSGTVYDSRKGLDGKNNRPLVELLHADASILKLNKDDAFSFLKMGANSLGVNLLIDLNESGEAMKVRMKPSAYFLENIAKGFFGELMMKQLFFAECLLQENKSQRIIPTITLPKSYEVNTVEDLSERVKNTYGADRFNAMMEVVNQKFKDNPSKLRAEELKLCYSPLWTLDEKDENARELLAVYSKADYIKKDWSCIALKRLLKDPQRDILTMSDKEVFDYIDDFVQPYLPKQAVELFDGEIGGGDIESTGGLIETVGGATSIVQVNQAVSRGEMSEQAAEEFLTLAFKISPQQAARLIDQGKAKDLGQQENE